MWPGSLSQGCSSGFGPACVIDFDFYSLSDRCSANPRGAARKRLATLLHSSSPLVAILKHSKQPSGLGEHLLVLGIGSPFLVDRKGKPKDNISVSVRYVEFRPRAGRFSIGFLLGALEKFDKKWSVGHL